MDRKEWIELPVANFDNTGHINRWDTMLLKKEYIVAIFKYGDKCRIKPDYMDEGDLLVDISYEDLLIELFS